MACGAVLRRTAIREQRHSPWLASSSHAHRFAVPVVSDAWVVTTLTLGRIQRPKPRKNLDWAVGGVTGRCSAARGCHVRRSPVRETPRRLRNATLPFPNTVCEMEHRVVGVQYPSRLDGELFSALHFDKVRAFPVRSGAAPLTICTLSLPAGHPPAPAWLPAHPALAWTMPPRQPRSRA